MNTLQKSRAVTWVAVIVFGIIILMNEIPYIPRSLFRNATVLPFAFLFLLLTNKTKFTINKKEIPIVFAFLSLVFMMLVYKITGISTTGWGIYVNTLSHFFFFFSMLILADRLSEHQQKFLFIVLIGSLLFTIIQNTILYFRYGFEYFMIYVQDESIVSNATSTQFSTSLVLLGGTLLIAFLTSKKYRILWLILLLIITVFNILIAQRAINLILTIGLYAFILYVNVKRKLYANLILILTAFVLMIAVANYDITISFVSELLGSDRLTSKLMQIKRALEFGDIMRGGGSLTARYRLYTLSLETWLSSPLTFLFGIGEHYESNLQIGNHSQFFDILGQYGIIGALLLYYTVGYTLSSLIKRLPVQKGSPLYRQILAVVFVFIIRGFIGTVLYGVIAIHLFIFLPLVVSRIQKGGNVI